MAAQSADEFSVMEEVLSALRKLDWAARQRVIRSASTLLDSLPHANSSPIQLTSGETKSGASSSRVTDFSTDRSMSAKEFMAYKEPRTDVEKVACLAYYATHYRSSPHFKTVDISQLNTEAAQQKFANAAYALNNALKAGYLAPGPKGTRQLSAVGERFVELMPDREKARASMMNNRPQRRQSKKR